MFCEKLNLNFLSRKCVHMNCRCVPTSRSLAGSLDYSNCDNCDRTHGAMWLTRPGIGDAAPIYIISVVLEIFESQDFTKSWASIICSPIDLVWTVSVSDRSGFHWHNSTKTIPSSSKDIYRVPQSHRFCKQSWFTFSTFCHLVSYCAITKWSLFKTVSVSCTQYWRTSVY